MKVDTTNKIKDLITETINSVKTLTESKTIIGEPIITPNGTIILPIHKISVGFVVGGGEYSNLGKHSSFNLPMAGGSGGGASVTPIGFVVEDSCGVRFVDVENKSAYQTILNLANKLINKLDDTNNFKEDNKI
ncbi:MAG: spore germination protein GerW family protein [Clostridia bacterium]